MLSLYTLHYALPGNFARQMNRNKATLKPRKPSTGPSIADMNQINQQKTEKKNAGDMKGFLQGIVKKGEQITQKVGEKIGISIKQKPAGNGVGEYCI